MHGVVDGTGIVVEDAGEFLAEFNLGRSELTSGTGWFGVLLFLAVDGGGVRVWRMLRFFGRRMSESCEGFGDIIRHGEINSSVCVIPIQVDATEDFAATVDCYVVVLFEAVDEVLGVGLANDFDTKVINNEIESCGTRDVMEESRSMTSWDIAIICKMFDELDVR